MREESVAQPSRSCSEEFVRFCQRRSVCPPRIKPLRQQEQYCSRSSVFTKGRRGSGDHSNSNFIPQQSQNSHRSPHSIYPLHHHCSFVDEGEFNPPQVHAQLAQLALLLMPVRSGLLHWAGTRLSTMRTIKSSVGSWSLNIQHKCLRSPSHMDFALSRPFVIHPGTLQMNHTTPPTSLQRHFHVLLTGVISPSTSKATI